jgi:hypothetical protein
MHCGVAVGGRKEGVDLVASVRFIRSQIGRSCSSYSRGGIGKEKQLTIRFDGRCCEKFGKVSSTWTRLE